MINQEWVKGSNVNLTVELGRCTRTVEDVSNWRKGTIVKLDESLVNQLKLYANKYQIGTGSIFKLPDGEMDLLINSLTITKENQLREGKKDES